MNRLELIRELEAYETRKIEFTNVLKDMESYYFDKGCISFKLQTKDHKKHYKESGVRFNTELMKGYIKEEILLLDKKIIDKIELLRG